MATSSIPKGKDSCLSTTSSVNVTETPIVVASSSVNNGKNNIVRPRSLMDNSNWWKHVIAGAFAGGVSRTVTAPLDRVKVLLQVQGAQLVSIRGCYYYMIKEGGVRSFWMGNGINVMKVAPENALKFTFHDQIKLIMHDQMKSELGFVERFISGSIAGSLSQTVIYPMEVLKTRFCLRKTGQYKGLLDAIMKIYHAEGVRAFYKGYIANLLGIIPYAGIDLATYETLKKMYIQRHPGNPPLGLYLVCGTVSNITGVCIVYPLTLIRTRLQAQTTNPMMPIYKVFKKIIAEEGYCGLYRGILPNFLKCTPAVSINYFVYEFTRILLGAEMS
ncbi:calcium-binding mitochondrial carrier protein SCaMC-2 [Tetranychus urticae]|uniref:Uncharacterized protein n=1 Tax=Tetranychus urticae TaxID=32264 RepID=T1KZP9_TETUR|nr:calcium-binding mitochondrial carrier protein SCaMC-2 [Tetranychus urticae]